MVACNRCGETIEDLEHTCQFCGRKYCSRHRLPENHDCPTAPHETNIGRYFESDINAIKREGGVASRSESVTTSTEPVGADRESARESTASHGDASEEDYRDVEYGTNTGSETESQSSSYDPAQIFSDRSRRFSLNLLKYRLRHYSWRAKLVVKRILRWVTIILALLGAVFLYFLLVEMGVL